MGSDLGPFFSAVSALRSTSMFDMRCEEETTVQPHSRARQEQLQLINNQLREEDDKWQDVSVDQGHWQQWGGYLAWRVRGPLEQKIRWGGWIGLESHAREESPWRISNSDTINVGIQGRLIETWRVRCEWHRSLPLLEAWPQKRGELKRSHCHGK